MAEVAEAEAAEAEAEGCNVAVPFSRNSWSGPFVVGRHVVLVPHVVQPEPKPSPGFWKAAPALATDARLSQNHWPAVPKSCRDWTETQ